MNRRQQGAEARIDHAGCEEQLESIGGDAEQIQQKWHGCVQAAEKRHQAGQRELRIFLHRHRRIGKPSGEQNEADRQELAGVRKIERSGHDHIGQGSGRVVDKLVPIEQLLAGLDENRQDDE